MNLVAKLAAASAAFSFVCVLTPIAGHADTGRFVYKTNFSSTFTARKRTPVLFHTSTTTSGKTASASRRSGSRGRKTSRLARSRVPGMNACKSAARKFGVPMSTALAVCRLESGFRCSAVGRAGELGLLQIKLATARGLGYRGSRRGLLSCSTGAYWGMKHLALAIRKGGVWKHNQGLGAKRPSKAARIYARKVAALRRHYR